MNDELLDDLEDFGAEVDDTIERLMGDEEMYVSFVNQLPQNQNIINLKKAIADKDFKTAEKEVHTLKGVALNLGFLPLVDVCMDLLLDLREGKTEKVDEQTNTISANFDSWVKIINKHKQ